MRYGEPQGSILSLILFLVNVNDMRSSLLHGRLVQYVDDMTIFSKGKSNEILELNAFVDLYDCVQYFQSLNLTTNS